MAEQPIVAVEFRATIVKVNTRANGAVALTLNIPEYQLSQAQMLVDWLLYDVKVIVAGVREPVEFLATLYAMKTTNDYSVDVTFLFDDLEVMKTLLGWLNMEVGVIVVDPSTDERAKARPPFGGS